MAHQADIPGSAAVEPNPRIFTVVLTGGIASGKTAVSERFGALGATVIDTDRIAHEIVEPGHPALQQIVEAFGPAFLDAEGRLDRRRMRAAIFADPRLKERLEAILHPLIAHEAMERIRAATGPYCILVIPLFAESARRDAAHWPRIDRVLVVDVDASVQIERAMKRDGIDRNQAKAMLRAQASRAQRIALADDVIDNSGGLEELDGQVAVLHAEYLALSSIRQVPNSRDGHFNDMD